MWHELKINIQSKFTIKLFKFLEGLERITLHSGRISLSILSSLETVQTSSTQTTS